MKSLVVLLFLMGLFQAKSWANASGAQAWSTQGCNTTSYAQDPTDRTLFWGRRLIYSGLAGEDAKNECSWQRWGIALYRADFTKRSLTFLSFALMPMLKIADGRTLTTAYDPTVAIINGVKYVAFECHGQGFSGSVGACIGQVGADNKISASTTRVYVDGVSSNANLITSASVPKLTSTTSGKAYLSWTQVQMEKSTNKWLKLVSRSMAFTPSMARVNSDTTAAVTVYNPKTSAGTADLFDIKEISPGKFFFTGARGDNGCISPLDTQPGCYNLEIGVTNGVTVANAFDNYSQSVHTLLDNPIEYFRWAYDPINKTWGVFGAAIQKPGAATVRTLPGGLYFIPIANNGNNLPVKNILICNPSTQPSPHWGVKNNQCMRSCGQIGGTRSFTTTCAANGMRDVGVAYDVPYCCASLCNPVTQPAPNWGVKSGQCLPSCGGRGGTRAFTTSCAANGMRDVGVAYDVPYCCASLCNPATQPAPHWGVKSGQCLPSCGGIGGTRAFTSSCAANGMRDAGGAYDVPYCCK